jgi:hypothetical protein
MVQSKLYCPTRARANAQTTIWHCFRLPRTRDRSTTAPLVLATTGVMPDWCLILSSREVSHSASMHWTITALKQGTRYGEDLTGTRLGYFPVISPRQSLILVSPGLLILLFTQRSNFPPIPNSLASQKSYM